MSTVKDEMWGNTEWIQMCGGKNSWKTFAWKTDKKFEDDFRRMSER
jgi:hypothetical protein